MSELNPYAPPQADLTPESGPNSQPLASRLFRLLAQLVDIVIMIAITAPLSFITGAYSRSAENAAAGQNFSLESILWGLAGIAIMFAINWNFLLQGQTIGKKVMKIRIVRKDGSPIDRKRIITHRMLPVGIVSMLGLPGGIAYIVDCLCIFRAGRNTLHDDFADTKVVAA